MRRLEQTAIDVDRLNDILDQDRRRLRPLKRQANAAERYDSVKAEVLALRLWLGGEELRRIRSRLAAATEEKTDGPRCADHQLDGGARGVARRARRPTSGSR